MPRYQVVVGDREFDILVTPKQGAYSVKVNGEPFEVVSHQLGESRALLLVNNEAHEVDIHPNGDRGERLVFLHGVEVPVSIEDYRIAELRKAAGMAKTGLADATLAAPMPGLVLDIRVSEGQQIKKGEPLVVIEAMKMENILKARFDATVKSVKVSPGQSVDKGAVLLEFQS